MVVDPEVVVEPEVVVDPEVVVVDVDSPVVESVEVDPVGVDPDVGVNSVVVE